MIKVDLIPYMRCTKCLRPAIIFQRYSGLHLCESHFIQDVETKAKRAVRTHRWILPGDRVGVAISGGKDSSALLYFLEKILSPRKDVDLIAITIDEGIRGYRTPEAPRDLARGMGIDCITASFEEEYGIPLDRILERTGEAQSCSYCGVLRRHLINKVARENGVTKLALGFNLDDEAQSILMNVLRGDVARLQRKAVPFPGMVPRIKPFILVPEREVALYSFLNVKGFELGRCPYSHNALRAEVRLMLNQYAWYHPSARHSLVNLGEELSGTTSPGKSPERGVCRICGEPCGTTCRSCEILGQVRQWS
ncbi:uncharacterized protein (TIGR00269 family) [Methanolinea mesophila]|uniref:TIGR00269 family protein n=1 Tax=Methanolinea mesophila TaxID=547055 RepID=UPI001FD73376|nr:TIGR00269 family protein [Methanolinea mesophila]MBP1929328.1 uncharacterized protein (TIGR00269 family) [Methanolinea mesophila]